MLLDDAAVGAVAQSIQPADFYSNANGRIYSAIRTVSDSGRKVDILTIIEQLRHEGQLDQAGGPDYIASLTSVVPSSANADFYAGIVRDCSLRRALIRLADDIASRSYVESENSGKLLEETQQKIFEISKDRNAVTSKPTKDIIPHAIDTIQKLYNSKDPYTGIPSGLSDLDDLTLGFQPSELIIIGARPSMGKTALALTMAANMAIRHKRPVGFFTLEMSDMALVIRLLSMEARIDSRKMRAHLLLASDFKEIANAASTIYEAPLYIADMPNMRLMALRTEARRLRAQYHVEIIFIDYLTLITSDNNDIPRFEQIAEISRSLKSLARELEIPIVALSQLRREAEGQRPNLSSIRESGSIEQDADVVMFLHREREDEKKAGEASDGIETELIVAKQRNGAVGTVKIVFKPKYTKFESLSKERR
jgi:replicative DNA helicase